MSFLFLLDDTMSMVSAQNQREWSMILSRLHQVMPRITDEVNPPNLPSCVAEVLESTHQSLRWQLQDLGEDEQEEVNGIPYPTMEGMKKVHISNLVGIINDAEWALNWRAGRRIPRISWERKYPTEWEEWFMTPDQLTKRGIRNAWRDWTPQDADLRRLKDSVNSEPDESPNLETPLYRALQGSPVSEDEAYDKAVEIIQQWNQLLAAFREVVFDFFGVTEEFFENHPRRRGRYRLADRDWFMRMMGTASNNIFDGDIYDQDAFQPQSLIWGIPYEERETPTFLPFWWKRMSLPEELDPYDIGRLDVMVAQVMAIFESERPIADGESSEECPICMEQIAVSNLVDPHPSGPCRIRVCRYCNTRAGQCPICRTPHHLQ